MSRSGGPTAVMARPRVVVTRPIPAPAIERLLAATAVEVLAENAARDREKLATAIADAEGVLSLVTERFDAELLDKATRLRVLANMAVGYDNVDVAAATARGILVTNTPGVLTETSADLAVALMLAVARRVVEGDRLVRAGKFDRWGPLMLLGKDLYGATLGIAGMGRIGEAVARRCALGFGMRVIYWSRNRKPAIEAAIRARQVDVRQVDKAELLASSDFLSLHLPLSVETRHFIDREALAKMRPDSVLINTGRGPLVDEAALAEALVARKIRGAGLDVYEDEPVVYPGLLGLDKVVLLPHIASASDVTRERMAMLAVDNLLEALAGRRPPCLVNPEAWRD